MIGVSLVVVYEASLDSVAELWQKSAADLGFEQVTRLELFDQGWECELGEDDCVQVTAASHSAQEDTTWLEFWFREPDYDRHRKVLEDLLALPQSPVEVVLVDFSSDSAAPFFTYDADALSPDEFADTYEFAYHGDALHQLRAVRLDRVKSPEVWERLASSREMGWSKKDGFAFLDVHWDQAGEPTPATDVVTGLATEGRLWEGLGEAFEAYAQGSVLVVSLSRLEGEDSYAAWCQAGAGVARLMEEAVSEGDLLTRFHSPRRVAWLRPGLSSAQARVEAQTLADRLGERFPGLGGLVVPASWPDEASEPSELFELLLAREAPGCPEASSF